MDNLAIQLPTIAEAGTWPRLDPRTGLWLCKSCWNSGSWKHRCAHGPCKCTKCHGPSAPNRAAPADVQGDLLDGIDGIAITAKS